MIKKIVIVAIVCVMLFSTWNTHPAKAEDNYTIYQVTVNSDYKQVYDKAIDILAFKDELFIDIDNLGYMTGFATEISNNVITFKRSYKTVEFDISNKTISYRKTIEEITDIIQYNGMYYVPLNAASYYLNTRCYFNNGFLCFLTAETTFDEMYEKYAPYYMDSDLLMPRDMNQNFGSMLTMYLWSGLINDYSAYNDEDMEIIYRKIVANDEEKQNAFVTLVDGYDEIHTKAGYMTKPTKMIGELLMGSDYNVIEEFAKQATEAGDTVGETVTGFIAFDDAISPIFDLTKKTADDVKLISNYNYIYVDALKKGYIDTSETSVSSLQYRDTYKIINMCNSDRVSDLSLLENTLEVVGNEIKGKVLSEISLHAKAVAMGLKLVGEFTGINDDVDGYWEKWAHAAFQLEVIDIGRGLSSKMVKDADEITTKNLESYKYNCILFFRTITFMNEEYKIAVPGIFQKEINAVVAIADYELWFDDVNYLRDVCVSVEEVDSFYNGDTTINSDIPTDDGTSTTENTSATNNNNPIIVGNTVGQIVGGYWDSRWRTNEEISTLIEAGEMLFIYNQYGELVKETELNGYTVEELTEWRENGRSEVWDENSVTQGIVDNYRYHLDIDFGFHETWADAYYFNYPNQNATVTNISPDNMPEIHKIDERKVLPYVEKIVDDEFGKGALEPEYSLAYECDIDNDGELEMIINANNLDIKLCEAEDGEWYIFSCIVESDGQIFFINEEYYHEGGYLHLNAIQNVIDIDGDGVCEIISYDFGDPNRVSIIEYNDGDIKTRVTYIYGYQIYG